MTEPLITKFGTARIGANGYYKISSSEKGHYNKLLHRLIFEDFYNIDLNEEFPDGVIIHHEDGNKLNNEMWNLVPMTKEEHIRIHHKGKTISEEHKHRISEANTGRFHSQENKEKMSKAHKGKILSEEHKHKISETTGTSGYFRVSKSKELRCKQGFYWRYWYYDEKGKRRSITSVDLDKLEQKVIDKGLPWIILDEEKARLTMEENQ